MTESRTVPRFPELEGLRGYLAIWVALSHALPAAAYWRSGRIPGVFLDGTHPVGVFVILSGFVIAHLLVSRQEPYPVYITRRLFRLYPSFLLCCALGYFTTPLALEFARSVSWANEGFWAQHLETRVEHLVEIQSHFWPHALAHATLLHGAIPGEWLKHAAVTFLGPAWSISLEWQFYLVAPLLLWALRRPGPAVAILLACLVLQVALAAGWLGTFFKYSFLPAASSLFAIGIASRLFYDRLKKCRLHIGVAALFCVLVVKANVTVWPPLVIWSVFFSYVVWGDTAPRVKELFDLMFKSRPALWLGSASYSLYLVHVPILTIFAIGTVRLASNPSNHLIFFWQLVAIAASCAVAGALYQLVERPGIAFGGFVARRVGNLLSGSGREHLPSK